MEEIPTNREYTEKVCRSCHSTLSETDPEFVQCFDSFAFDEVAGSDDLDDRTRMMAILAMLIGCQGMDEYTSILPVALNVGITPVEVKEILYQSVAYLGMGRISQLLSITNDILASRGIRLPLPSQATTTAETRLQAGRQAQVTIFGESVIESYNSSPEESRHINRWLWTNCFGDWYSRTGLDMKQREMITFCFLAAQGGCEPQLTGHAAANMRVGNDKAFLIKIISQGIPYIGYPRSLNALRCVNDAAAKE